MPLLMLEESLKFKSRDTGFLRTLPVTTITSVFGRWRNWEEQLSSKNTEVWFLMQFSFQAKGFAHNSNSNYIIFLLFYLSFKRGKAL